MKLKITEEKENKLFNRKEIEGFIESDATPSRQDVAKLLAEKFSVPAENIKIKKITGKFGAKVFDIEANIYSSKEEKDSIELKKKKDGGAEKKADETEEAAKPEEAQPQSEQKEAEPETKPEEVKEEKPQEEEKKEEKTEQKPEENKPESQ